MEAKALHFRYVPFRWTYKTCPLEENIPLPPAATVGDQRLLKRKPSYKMCLYQHVYDDVFTKLLELIESLYCIYIEENGYMRMANLLWIFLSWTDTYHKQLYLFIILLSVTWVLWYWACRILMLLEPYLITQMHDCGHRGRAGYSDVRDWFGTAERDAHQICCIRLSKRWRRIGVHKVVCTIHQLVQDGCPSVRGSDRWVNQLV